jgi:hypothetical protein
MGRPEVIVSKFVSLYRKRTITLNELVDFFVHQIIDSRRERDSASLLELLPPEVATDVLPFVQRLIAIGYDSYPGAVGRARTDDEVAEFTIGLHEMDRALRESSSSEK